jgi:hypothetical protein
MDRGQLNLNMASASWLQISFVGDDGGTEQLCSISCNSSEVDSVIIEEIAADESGRSFVVKVSESQAFYYWLSEKSLSHGLHLLNKVLIHSPLYRQFHFIPNELRNF